MSKYTLGYACVAASETFIGATTSSKIGFALAVLAVGAALWDAADEITAHFDKRLDKLSNNAELRPDMPGNRAPSIEGTHATPL